MCLLALIKQAVQPEICIKGLSLEVLAGAGMRISNPLV